MRSDVCRRVARYLAEHQQAWDQRALGPSLGWLTVQSRYLRIASPLTPVLFVAGYVLRRPRLRLLSPPVSPALSPLPPPPVSLNQASRRPAFDRCHPPQSGLLGLLSSARPPCSPLGSTTDDCALSYLEPIYITIRRRLAKITIELLTTSPKLA